MRLKVRENAIVDPILQRLGKYNKSDLNTRTYTQNYFQKLKYDDKRKGKKQIQFNKTIFQESTDTKKLFPSRKSYSNMNSDINVQKTEKVKSLKIFPNKLQESEYKGILSKSMIEEDNSRIKKPHSILNIPSPILRRINDLKSLIPCEIDEKCNQKRIHRAKTVAQIGSTAERVFPEIIKNQDRGKKEKNEKICYNNILRKQPWAIDQLTDVITYSGGPKFKEDNLSTKPNLISYEVVLKSRNNNNIIKTSKSFNLSLIST